MTHVRPASVVASVLRSSDAGVPDAENAAAHGIAAKTVRRWRREYGRRGRPRALPHGSAACPRCDDAVLDGAAFVELFGWYLGDGHITKSVRGTYTLHVVNDRRYAALNDRLLLLMTRVKPGGRPHWRDRPGAVLTSMGWQHWPCLFPQHGPGRKHERNLGMEDWQWELIERHPGEFLRGLMHSDGCRVNNWASREVAGELKRYDYPRWQFVNHSEEIIEWCTRTLDLLGVPWRRSSWKTVSVSTRAGVAELDAIVGPKR
ncbi:MAG TPA: transcriptional regulator [Nocardioides sp.]|uniref:transcriptional regulator n=1 Tax=Nocardioides sp. TaxID=35761 RepID=UPI002D7FCDFC|nr:transcriptional regulator [Nocardioides sp.]HET6652593.1 transcriptional regulator [Nocardioides sp.]